VDAQGSGKADKRDINVKANASVKRDITNTDLNEEQGHDFGSGVRPDENSDLRRGVISAVPRVCKYFIKWMHGSNWTENVVSNEACVSLIPPE
jgi:hypothetical protein